MTVAKEEKLVVVDPRGQPPALRQLSMAPRLDSLEGKTIYVVDINWPYTRQFTEELYKVLSEKFPKSKFVFRDKAGTYGEDDVDLWNEIQEQADAMVLSIGH